MKMVKKILLGMVATAIVIALSGCKIPGTDDDRGVIKGSYNNYSIDYTNETDGYRAYKPTKLKHAGALVKVTFKEPANDNWSKMGVIFDLTEDENNVREFYIIGLAGANTANCYVSKFSNVTDIQAENFGTKLSTNPAVEKVIWNTKVSNGIGTITRPNADEDGNISYYVFYKEFKNPGSDPTKGYFEWGVFGFNEEKAKEAKKAVQKADCDLAALTVIDPALASGTIPNAFNLGSLESLPQNNIAVYAKIDAGKSLKGTWDYLDTYKEAEEVVE